MIQACPNRSKKHPSGAAAWFRASLLAAFMFMPCAGAAQAAAATTCERVVLSADPDFPPLSHREHGDFRGAALEIATRTLQRIKLPYEIRHVGPLQKVLLAAGEGRVDMVAGLNDTAERRKTLAFSQYAIFSNPVAIFTRADSNIDDKTREGLASLRGGALAGSRFGAELDRRIASGLTVETSESIDQNFNRLHGGQIDYVISSYYPAHSYLVRMRRESEFKALQPFAAITDYFIAWSRASACRDKQEAFDAALASMVRSGELRRILEVHIDQVRLSRRQGAGK